MACGWAARLGGATRGAGGAPEVDAAVGLEEENKLVAVELVLGVQDDHRQVALHDLLADDLRGRGAGDAGARASVEKRWWRARCRGHLQGALFVLDLLAWWVEGGRKAGVTIGRFGRAQALGATRGRTLARSCRRSSLVAMRRMYFFSPWPALQGDARAQMRSQRGPTGGARGRHHRTCSRGRGSRPWARTRQSPRWRSCSPPRPGPRRGRPPPARHRG